MLPRENSMPDTDAGSGALVEAPPMQAQPSAMCSTTLSVGSTSGGALTSGDKQPEERNYLVDIAKLYAKGSKHTLDSLKEQLKNDREMMFRVVREHKDGWRLLKHANPDLRADRELLLAAVKSPHGGWKALLSAPIELREDRDLGIEAVRKNAAALEMLSPRLRQDAQLVSEALGAFSKRIQPSRRTTAALEWDRGAQSRRERGGAGEGRGKRASAGGAAAEHGAGEAFVRERLMLELETGVGELHTNEDGTQVRLLQVAALRIMNPQGLVLAVLGRHEGGVCKPHCALPGQRIPSGCQPREIADRFLETRLQGLQRWLKVDENFELVAKESDAKKASVATQYRKATFNITAKPGMPWHKVARRVQVRALSSSPHVTMMRQTLSKRFVVNPGSLAPKPPDMYTLSVHQGRHQPIEPQDAVDVYAWIPAWEFEWLQSSKLGHDALDDWLSGVDVGAHAAGAGRWGMSPTVSSPRSESPRSPWSPSRMSGGRGTSRTPTLQSQGPPMSPTGGGDTAGGARAPSALQAVDEAAATCVGGFSGTGRSVRSSMGATVSTGGAIVAGARPQSRSEARPRGAPQTSRPQSARRPASGARREA